MESSTEIEDFMKTYMILSMILGGVLIAAVAFADAEDRFKGGTHDGYERAEFIQVVPPDFDLIYARFTGGSYDGYGLNSVTNTLVLSQGPAGTHFIFH